jgi:hypothetical protein
MTPSGNMNTFGAFLSSRWNPIDNQWMI